VTAPRLLVETCAAYFAALPALTWLRRRPGGRAGERFPLRQVQVSTRYPASIVIESPSCTSAINPPTCPRCDVPDTSHRYARKAPSVSAP